MEAKTNREMVKAVALAMLILRKTGAEAWSSDLAERFDIAPNLRMSLVRHRDLIANLKPRHSAIAVCSDCDETQLVGWSDAPFKCTLTDLCDGQVKRIAAPPDSTASDALMGRPYV